MSVILDSGRATDNRFLGWVANNLGLSWIGQIQSGRPYPISTGSAGFGSSARFFGAGSETQQRPSELPDGSLTTAGIASFDGANALFGPGAVAACITAGFGAAQCAGIQNTFLSPVAKSGAIDAITGDAVDFKLANGNVGRDAGRGSAFVRFDASLHKNFTIHENVKLELRFDAFNDFNHSNWGSFNSNDVLSVLGPSVTRDADGNITGVAPDFFSCNTCMRPNGTYAGNNGQILHLSDLQKGKVSPDLTNPVFGGLGDPAADDPLGIGPRKLQLSFHVRF
jgi:hypothetical protein